MLAGSQLYRRRRQPLYAISYFTVLCLPELSMGRVDPWVELGWVGSTIAKVQKIERIILMYLKHG